MLVIVINKRTKSKRTKISQQSQKNANNQFVKTILNKEHFDNKINNVEFKLLITTIINEILFYKQMHE